MASLRKDPRNYSKYWYACITIPGKGQTQRCTKVLASERNRGEAMAIAERWEREAKHLGPALHLANRHAVLETFVTATQKAISGDMTEADAREMLDRILEATGQNAIKNESTRSFSERWLKAQIVGLAESSKLSYELAIRLFVEHLGSAADKPLRAVRPEHIEGFKTTRMGSGISAKTVDRDLKVVRSVFKSAIKQGHLSFDPSQTISLVSRKNKSETQTISREVFQIEELDAILEAAEGEWRTAVFIGRYVGARMSNCVGMRWENIDLAADVIRFIDCKTGKNLRVPLHRRLKAHLSSLTKKENTNDALCPSLIGKKTGGKVGLSKQFQKIMAKAGVETRRVESKVLHKKAGTTTRTLARRSFHSIRHSFNTQLANAGVHQDVRCRVIGHANTGINDGYNHPEIDVDKAAIDTLP